MDAHVSIVSTNIMVSMETWSQWLIRQKRVFFKALKDIMDVINEHHLIQLMYSSLFCLHRIFLNYKAKMYFVKCHKVKMLLILDVLHILCFYFPHSFKSCSYKAVWLYWQHVVFFAKAVLGEPASTTDSSHPPPGSSAKIEMAIRVLCFFKRQKGMEIRPGR